MIPGDQIAVTVAVAIAVAIAPALAFEIFTHDIDLWWRRGPQFRHFGGEHALIAIEPYAGGRAFIARHARWWGNLLSRHRVQAGTDRFYAPH